MQIHLEHTDWSALIERFKDVKILVIGDVMLDRFVWGRVERISPEAPVPVVQVVKESAMPGGAANVSANIATLRGHSYLCGLVGQDLMGQELVKHLKDLDIYTSLILHDPSRPTTVKERIIAHSQQVVRIDREHSGPINNVQLQAILSSVEQVLPEMDIVVIEDYGKGLITSELIQALTALCRKYGKRIAVDPKEEHFSYYKGVTTMTPNHHEAEKATGIKIQDEASLLQAGQKLLVDLQCEAVLITRGEEGMSLFQADQEVIHIPTIAQEVYDVSGAGDTVIATFTLALGAGASFSEAAYLSNIAGGIVVGKVGVATIHPQELKDHLCAP